MRIERIVLEDHGNAPIAGRAVVDQFPADADFAAGDALEAGDHAQRRRLGAAGGADQDHELAVFDIEVDAMHGTEGAIVFLEVFQLQPGHCVIP